MDFEEWLRKQPFGGPSRIPGKSLLSDSTINLMRKAWDAGQEQLNDFYTGQDVVKELAEERVLYGPRGDVRD
jgi:hypothetical protein